MATVQLTPLIFNKFRGIREQNGVNSGGEISAITCRNVELFNSEIGGEVGIKTIDGNSELYTVNSNYNIIGIYETAQKVTENSDSYTKYLLVYAEHKTESYGKLGYINNQGSFVNIPLPDNKNFTKTGKCNGLTMTSTAYDVFIFTNGVEAVSVSFAESPNPKLRIISDNSTGATPATDYQGHPIQFIAMTVFNGFLVVATKYGVRASHQNNIYTWNDNPQGAAYSWYIDYSKPVTALYAYTGGLFIFTSDTTDFITGSPNETGNKLLNTAGVGCMDYDSIVKHDTYLFFYDNNQKNIYYIENIDNGQTRPSGPIAKEIQSQFKRVEKIRLYSCIYNSRNEIWCIITERINDTNLIDRIFVYDYFQGEFIEREHQTIADLLLTNNSILFANKNKIFVENNGTAFDGTYYNSEYKTTFINAADNTNLKKQKTPLLIVLNDNYINDFYVQLIVNGKAKSEKHINKTSKAEGYYVPTDMLEDEDVPDTMKYGTAKYCEENPYSKTVVEVSTPQTWYTLAIRIFTKTVGQGFSINSMELKNIKAKLKTKGR